uniref:Uncharacterized protein n=1 Tax=Panagrolaimus davidi TaxID=227884 RepID=A0A914NYW4_9BILA
MESLDNLASDGKNYEQNGGDVKFVGKEREGIELELENKQLAFKFCYDGCMKKTVRACYDSKNPNLDAKGECGPGQCEFKAGISEDAGKPFLWFKKELYNKGFGANGMCTTAIMKNPEATPDGFLPFSSCEPLKHDGNVVKLYVNHVEPGCPLYVLNAKKWTPPSTTTTQNSSGTTVPDQTTSKSSEANTTLWIGIGIGIFILLIVLIGFGYCCYRTQIQKKPLSGKKKELQPNVFIPEASKKATVVKEKTEDEKEVIVAKPEPSKETTVKRRDTNVGLINKETKEKLEKFYPPGPIRAFDRREIEILCCVRISIMFKTIEMLIDDAIKALNERGVTFDEKCNIIQMPPKAEKYLRSRKTPEYVRSFAFGNVFRELIDSQTKVYDTFSIPLLFSIVLQRRYNAINRRKAFTWIRRELIIIEKEFTAEERSKLPYPICAIEAACKMDFNGFKSVSLLDSLSGDDDDDTQGSTRASEKPREN